MAEADLVRVIKWLRAARNPCYALLPTSEYAGKVAGVEFTCPAARTRSNNSVAATHFSTYLLLVRPRS